MTISMPQFVTRKQAAALMGVATQTLSNWSVKKIGPKAYNPTGGKALYCPQEIAAWVRGEPIQVEPVPVKRGRGRPPKLPRA